MIKYKWDLNVLKSDFKKINKLLINNCSDRNIENDLNKILYMLNLNDNFNSNEDRISFQKEVIDTLKLVKRSNNKSSDNNQQYKILKMINEDSKELLKSINLRHLHKRRKKEHNSGLFEGLLWTDFTLLSIDRDFYNQFCELKENNRLNIVNDDNDTWIIKLKSINKNYYQVNYNKSLDDIINIFHSFALYQLNEKNNNRHSSIYDLTLEIFYYLVSSDILRNKYVAESYNIKYNVYNSFKVGLKEFQYITYHNDDLEYDNNTSNYRIPKKSSIFREEIVQKFYNFIDYDYLSLSIKNTYSHLLAIYLYNQYKNDSQKCINNIKTLIDNIGIVDDNQIIESLDIDINDFVQGNYFEEFYQTCKKEYKKKKIVD